MNEAESLTRDPHTLYFEQDIDGVSCSVNLLSLQMVIDPKAGLQTVSICLLRPLSNGEIKDTYSGFAVCAPGDLPQIEAGHKLAFERAISVCRGTRLTREMIAKLHEEGTRSRKLILQYRKKPNRTEDGYQSSHDLSRRAIFQALHPNGK